MSEELIYATELEAVRSHYATIETGIASLASKADGLTINGLDDLDGQHAVSTVRKEVKGVRNAVERTRKRLKAPALARGRAIDEEAKRITAALLDIEEPLREQEAAVERERQRIQEAEAAARRAKMDKRMALLQDVGARMTYSDVCDLSDDEFEEVYAAESDRFTAAEAERIAREHAEAARLAELEAERDRVAAERAELEAMRAELEAAKRAAEPAAAAVEVVEDAVDVVVAPVEVADVVVEDVAVEEVQSGPDAMNRSDAVHVRALIAPLDNMLANAVNVIGGIHTAVAVQSAFERLTGTLSALADELEA